MGTLVHVDPGDILVVQIEVDDDPGFLEELHALGEQLGLSGVIVLEPGATIEGLTPAELAEAGLMRKPDLWHLDDDGDYRDSRNAIVWCPHWGTPSDHTRQLHEGGDG